MLEKIESELSKAKAGERLGLRRRAELVRGLLAETGGPHLD
jgi:hypothetical protein